MYSLEVSVVVVPACFLPHEALCILYKIRIKLMSSNIFPNITSILVVAVQMMSWSFSIVLVTDQGCQL